MKDLPSLLAGVAADLLSGKTAAENKAASKSKYGLQGKWGRPFLSPKELAAQLKISEKTLERLRKNGSGPLFKKIGTKQIRYAIADVEAWLDTITATNVSDSK